MSLAGQGEMVVWQAQGSQRLGVDLTIPAQCRPAFLRYCHMESDWRLSPAINPIGTALYCRGLSGRLSWPRFPWGQL